MKSALAFAIVFVPLLISALPQGTKNEELKNLYQQCANYELSCCSNFRSSAEGSAEFDASGSGVNLIGNAIGVLGNAVTQPLQQVIPISILSGCSPIIGNAQIQCTNYIACCVPDEHPQGQHEDGHEKGENECKILKDNSVKTNEGLLHL
ncbi:hypothetical protein BJY01DRAFT_248858 [Aspergillus pseudoustus]|uniref:Hydrophobin n=1 Tax=Aspergillus pseudoustus TaxID=1810923 RepID=A0ABR4JS78_9EURO